MRTFAKKPKATQQAKSTKVGRAISGQSRVVHSILHLQRTIGNQAVQRLLQSKTEDLEASSVSSASTGFAHDFSRIPVHASARSNIQPKLKINAPGDIYEQEADRVADHVMHMPDPQLQRACPCGGGCPRCQTKEHSQEHELLHTKRVQATDAGELVAPPIVHEVLRSPGKPLSPTNRTFFEPRFGQDFSHVRIHNDVKATLAAESVNAKAFTTGRSIVFSTGQYQPETVKGKHLLAHELTHVVQQEGPSLFHNFSSDKGSTYHQALGLYRQPATKDAEEDIKESADSTEKETTKPDPTTPVIAVEINEGKVFLVFASGEVRSGTADTDLLAGNYILKPEVANTKWVIERTKYGPQFKTGMRFYIVPEVKNIWGLTYPDEIPLTVGAGGRVLNADFNLNVDQFAQVYYDIDHRSENGNLSKWLVVIYPDGSTVDIHIDQIGDETLSEGTAKLVQSQGTFGPGNRIYPKVMNKTSTPRLWAAKQQALQAMGEYDLEFMIGTFPTVFFILTIGPTVSVGGGRVTGSRSRIPGRFNRGKYGSSSSKGSQSAGKTGGGKSGGGPKSSIPDPAAAKAAQDIFKRIKSSGKEVVVNLGGTGEIKGAINVNIGRSSMPKDPNMVPNLVKAPARQIGKLFPKGLVDKIVSHNVEPTRINWTETAVGAKQILKPGGTANITQLGGSQAKEIAQAFKQQGFNVTIEFDAQVIAVKPL